MTRLRVEVFVNVRCSLVLVGVLLSVGCGSPGSSGDPAGQPSAAGASGASGANGAPGATNPATPSASAGGSFGGSYSVPVSVELTGAATFDVTELTWTVAGGVATLAYNLPRALVGTAVHVVFTGPFDPATGHATLTGAAGTADCTIAPLTIVCNEHMQGLLPLASDMAVVEKLASGYPGPPADRLAVAAQFAGDPIGIATLDLTRPGVPEPVEPVVEPEPNHGK
jgi:hypothetical protein